MTGKILAQDIEKQLAHIFGTMVNPVALVFFKSEKNNCQYCEEMQQLLDELIGLATQITLKIIDVEENPEIAAKYRDCLVPSVMIAGVDGEELKDYGIRFVGVPGGHEFTSLIQAIMLVSSQASGLSQESRASLAKIAKPVLLQVFVTPSCPYCPQAVISAHRLAFENSYIQAEMVEAMEFPELAVRYGVSGVPHTVINSGAGEIIGAVPERALLSSIHEVLEQA